MMPVVKGYVWDVDRRISFIEVVNRSTSPDHGNLLVVREVINVNTLKASQ